ncbi:hypothetical protein SE17_37355, partial [Kouleothrix aurantiaca]
MQPTSHASSPQNSADGCLHFLLFAVAAAWIAGVTLVLQAGGWLYDQVSQAQGESVPWWFWLALALGQALLAGGPAALLAGLVRSPRFRAIY